MLQNYTFKYSNYLTFVTKMDTSRIGIALEQDKKSQLIELAKEKGLKLAPYCRMVLIERIEGGENASNWIF